MTRDVVRKARLSGERTEDIESLLSSMEADRNIASSDVLVDMAHLVMLTRQRIVNETHAKTLMRELLEMYESGVPIDAYDPSCEDIHAGIETVLTKKTGGDAGGRLHKSRMTNLTTLIHNQGNFHWKFACQVPHIKVNDFNPGDTSHIFLASIGLLRKVSVHAVWFSDHEPELLY